MFDVARQDVMKACGEVKAIQIWKFWKLWKSVSFWIFALPRIPNAQNLALCKFWLAMFGVFWTNYCLVSKK